MKPFKLHINYRRTVRSMLLPTLFVSIVMTSTSASAYDWSNDYGIYTTAERDDNFRLTEEDPIETNTTSLRLNAELRGASEVSNLQLGIGASKTSYSEASIEDSEDYRLFMKTKRRGERWSGELDLYLDLTPTTETELLDSGNRTDGERKSIRFAPSANYQLDETKSLNASFIFNDVSYDTVSLTGYNNNSLSMSWLNQYRENRDVSINGSVSEFEPEDGESTTVSSIGLGYGFSISEVTRYDLRLGYSTADRPGGSESDGNSSVEIQHSLDERNGFAMFLGNGYAESGLGEVRYETQLNLSWDHALAERMQFRLTAEGVSTDDRDYIELVAGGSYQLTREISLAANYRYRTQHTDNEDADSNSVYLSLSYSPVSRWSHEL